MLLSLSLGFNGVFFLGETHFLLHYHWECRYSVIVITKQWIKCAYLVKLKHSLPLSNDNECDWLPNVKPYQLKRMVTLGKFHCVWDTFFRSFSFSLFFDELAFFFFLIRFCYLYIYIFVLLKNQAFTVECKIVDKSNEESVASHTLCLCHTNIHIKKTFDSSMLSLEFAFQFLCKNRSMQKINKQYTHTHTQTKKL